MSCKIKYRYLERKSFPFFLNLILQIAPKFFLILLCTGKINSQTFHISGNISTDSVPVSFALVTFIDQSDTSKKYSAITDTSGNYQLSIITAIKNDNPIIPHSIELEQNYPNPFASSTAIQYKVNKPVDARIKIYNILGQEIRELKSGWLNAGVYEIIWNGTNNCGNKVAPGIYFYQLLTANEILVKKMIFNFKNKSIDGPVINNNNYNKRMTKRTITTGTSYLVKIIETDSTQPRILSDEYDDIEVQKDTTLDFNVEGGKIVFSSPDSIGYDQIFIVYPDGTGLKQLTYGSRGHSMPRWSPDGKKIVFVSDSLGTTLGNPMFIMDENGTNSRAVKEFHYNPSYAFYQPGDYPSWSPDGNKIVFDWCTHCEYGTLIKDIYVVDLITDQMKQLTFGDPWHDTTIKYPAGSNGSPVFSPDGEKIYFNSSRDDSIYGTISGIFSMDTEGNNVQGVICTHTFDEYYVSPSISPDNKKIIFIHGNKTVSKLFAANIDGSNITLVCDPPNGKWVYLPQFSPSSKRVIFISDVLYIINLDGSNLRKLQLPGNFLNYYYDWINK